MKTVFHRPGALAAGGVLLAAVAVVGPGQGSAYAADDVDCIPLGTRSGSISTTVPYTWTDQQCRSVYQSDRRVHVIRVKQARCPVRVPSVRARATVALPGGFDRDEQTKKGEPCPTLTVIVMGTMRAEVQLSILTQPGDQSATTVIRPV